MSVADGGIGIPGVDLVIARFKLWLEEIG